MAVYIPTSTTMKTCSTCKYRWTRRALWYCRQTTIEAARLIGNESQMKEAKGCKDWKD